MIQDIPDDFYNFTLDALNDVYLDSIYVTKFVQFTVRLYDRLMKTV